MRTRAVLAAALLLAACGREAGPAPPTDRLRFALGQALGDFDPREAWSTASQVLQRQVYEGLVEYRPGSREEFQGLLAASWEISADGLEWRFRLRSDARFHDPHPAPLWPGGTRPVTAADVVDSFLRLADPRTDGGNAFVLEGLLAGLDDFRRRCGGSAEEAEAAWEEALAGGLPGLRADGDAAVVLRLARPAPDLLARLASAYLVVTPPEAFRHPERGLTDHPVGSGPYVLAEWKPPTRARFTATPGWRGDADAFGPQPHVRELVFESVPEGATRTLLFENGEIDRLSPGQDSFGSLVVDDAPAPDLRARGVRLLVSDTPDLSMLVLNLDDPVLGVRPGDEAGNTRRLALRRAIALSFPYERWHRVIRNGVWAEPARRWLPPGLRETAGLPESAWRRADPAEARRLLAEAGWGAEQPLPELELSVVAGNQAVADLADLLAAGLAEAGLPCRVQAWSAAEYSQRAQQGQLQLHVWSWALDWPDAANLLQIFHGANAGGGVNRANLRSAELDALLDRFAALPPSAERDALAARIVGLLDAELPVVPVDHRRGYLLLQPWLQNVEVNPFDLFPCKRFVLAPAD